MLYYFHFYHTILKLFLAQTGLSKQAVNTFIDNFNMDETLNIINNQFDELQKNIEYSTKISEEANKFFCQCQINYKSPQDAVEHFEHYMKNHLKDDNKTDAHKLFFENLKYYSENTSGISANSEIYKTILYEIFKSIMELISDDIQGKTDEITDISTALTEKQKLINSIEIPVTSEEYKKRTEFNSKYNKLYELIEQREQELLEIHNWLSILFFSFYFIH